MEFALGLTIGSPSTLPPPAAYSPTQQTLTYTYTRSTAAVNSGLIFTVEKSNNVAGPWNTVGLSQTVTNLGATQQVSVTMPASVPGLLVRLRVTEP